MENKNELETLLECKTLVDCARLLYGINYTNGRVKKDIINYCNRVYDLDIIENIKKNNQHFCLECGAPVETGKKFCNSSCAAKYNNKRRTLSDKTKEKISNSLKKGRIKHTFICENCGKEFTSNRNNRKFCSVKCSHDSEETKLKIKERAYQRISDGTFSGWKTRNVRSYPEIFWEGVLNGNSIDFVSEDFSTKKYFLDFLITKGDKKIDLEIDGKQHKERVEHDKERDFFLKENGFIVYRVEWNTINTEDGKAKMRQKINDFLEFYKTL